MNEAAERHIAYVFERLASYKQPKAQKAEAPEVPKVKAPAEKTDKKGD